MSFCIQVLTSPPRTLASKKIVKDPNIQIVIIQETTLGDKKQLIYINNFHCEKRNSFLLITFTAVKDFIMQNQILNSFTYYYNRTWE